MVSVPLHVLKQYFGISVKMGLKLVHNFQPLVSATSQMLGLQSILLYWGWMPQQELRLEADEDLVE